MVVQGVDELRVLEEGPFAGEKGGHVEVGEGFIGAVAVVAACVEGDVAKAVEVGEAEFEVVVVGADFGESEVVEVFEVVEAQEIVEFGHGRRLAHLCDGKSVGMGGARVLRTWRLRWCVGLLDRGD